MGCQKDIAKKIVSDCDSDYVFGLKGNQGILHEDVKLYFETEISKITTTEKGHGRIEAREYYRRTRILVAYSGQQLSEYYLNIILILS